MRTRIHPRAIGPGAAIFARSFVSGITVLAALTGPSAYASEPSSKGVKQFLDGYRTSLKGFDGSAAVCGDAGGKTAVMQSYLTGATQGLERVKTLQAGLTEEEAQDPAVVAAVAKIDATSQCTDRLRTTLGGPALAAATATVVNVAEDAGSTAEDFIASVDPGARADMAVLVAYQLGDTATTAAAGVNGEAVARLLGEADQIAPLCVGKFARAIKGSPPDGVAPDANPWGWCNAIAHKSDVAQAMVTDVSARGLTALGGVTAEVEGMVGGAAALAASKVDGVWAMAGDLFGKTRDIGAAYVAAGIPIPANVASAIDKADGTSKKAAKKVGKKPAELTAALETQVKQRTDTLTKTRARARAATKPGGKSAQGVEGRDGGGKGGAKGQADKPARATSGSTSPPKTAAKPPAKPTKPPAKPTKPAGRPNRR